MKVVLLQNVRNVGQKYDIKEVSNGYALNFLIPQGLAETATPGAEKRIQEEKAKMEVEKKVQEDLLLKNFKSLEGVRLVVTREANEQGHLFAGIHADELVSILKDQTELDLLAEHIALEKPIKETGEHKIPVKVQDMEGNFTLVVEAKG